MVIGIDSSVLLGFYQIKAGISGGAGLAGGATMKKVAPTAPWLGSPPTVQQTSAGVSAALSGKKLIDENAAQLDFAGASSDYKKLFALYQGLSTLSDVVNQYNAKNITSAEKGRIVSTFDKGLAEVISYASNTDFEKLRMVMGEAASVVKTTVTVPRAPTEYVTGPLTSSTTASVPNFEGDVKFNISVKRVNVVYDVPIDLAGMGSQTRSLGNVMAYINAQLDAVGVETKLVSQRIAATPRTIKVGGKDVEVSPGADQWALKLKIGTSETVTLSAPTTAPAVYVAQSVGQVKTAATASSDVSDGVTQRQLLKFQTEAGDVPAPTPATGETFWADGRVYSQTLAPQVLAVRDTKVGPDGSVYVLAEVNGKGEGVQAIKGQQDVALMKYDAAGKLIYSRTLGAGETATGLALAVSDDGLVAVAGSVTGALTGAQEGPVNSGSSGSFAKMSDSFVTLYDAKGQEIWTERRGARQADEATEVAFGVDGTVYVSGRSQSAMPGTASVGGWDSYIQAFKADSKNKVQTLFSETFGTVGSDKPAGMVVDGDSLVTATVEDGRAILRRFDISSGTPVQTSMRDLGDLQGGGIAGLALDDGQLVIAGTTSNPALNAGTLTQAAAGGSDVFVARLASDLSSGATDALAYYGGPGDDVATSLAVGDGKVYVGGSAGTGDLPGQPQVGKKDGFLAQIDVATGAVTWSSRFTGKDGVAAPSAIAVAPQGASVLDRLGFPAGLVNVPVSDRLTANSSVRAGDQFTLKAGSGLAKTVTIEEADTLDTLALKIRRAASFQVKVSIATVNGARQLKIEPLNDRMLIEIGVGKADKDALAMIGLPQGVVRKTEIVDGKTVMADGKDPLYGLGLKTTLNISSDEQLRHTLAELAAAQGIVRQAYKDLVAAASPKSAAATTAGKTGGVVPAYLTAQIASYQAALDRLTGGSGSSSGAGGLLGG